MSDYKRSGHHLNANYEYVANNIGYLYKYLSDKQSKANMRSSSFDLGSLCNSVTFEVNKPI